MTRPEPEGAEVAGDESGEDVQRGAAFLGTGDDFADVAAVGGGEDFDELGDQRPGEGAATDDRGEFPPEGRVVGEVGNQQVADNVGQA